MALKKWLFSQFYWSSSTWTMYPCRKLRLQTDLRRRLTILNSKYAFLEPYLFGRPLLSHFRYQLVVPWIAEHGLSPLVLLIRRQMILAVLSISLNRTLVLRQIDWAFWLYAFSGSLLLASLAASHSLQRCLRFYRWDLIYRDMQERRKYHEWHDRAKRQCWAEVKKVTRSYVCIVTASKVLLVRGTNFCLPSRSVID